MLIITSLLPSDMFVGELLECVVLIITILIPSDMFVGELLSVLC